MQGDKLMKPCNFKNRKAISTVIGTFFFVIVMAGAFTAFILMMQTNSNRQRVHINRPSDQALEVALLARLKQHRLPG